MPEESPKIWTKTEITRMWPQAHAELSGFKRVLQGKAGITAAQLDMALTLAQERYDQILNEH